MNISRWLHHCLDRLYLNKSLMKQGIKNITLGIGAMMTQTNTLAVAPACVPAASLLIQFPVYGPGKQQKVAQVLANLYSGGKPGRSSDSRSARHSCCSICKVADLFVLLFVTLPFKKK